MSVKALLHLHSYSLVFFLLLWHGHGQAVS